jgi:hypothetical protein
MILYAYCRHQLETPCQYRQLQAFWEDKKGTLLPSTPSMSSLQAYSPGSTPTMDTMPDMKVGVYLRSKWRFLIIQWELLFSRLYSSLMK